MGYTGLMRASTQEMEDFQKGDCNTTWKIINALSGQNNRSNPKAKNRDASVPFGDIVLLVEWIGYFAKQQLWTTNTSSSATS